MQQTHYVILGNGVAGIEAAITVRNREPSARISVVSMEHDHFYSRTALMYILCGQLSLQDTEPYGRDLYARMRFERVRARVTGLDAAAKALRLEGGGTLRYDRLLLAAGSRARPAPWAGAAGGGVHAFVTLQDLAALDAEAAAGKTVAVIGGGLIGVEVAEVLHLRGLKVHFLIREPWYFPVALDAAEAEVVAAHVRHHGVDVRTGLNVTALERDSAGRLVALQTEGAGQAGERLPVDLVVCAIGVVPNTEFLRASGLALAAGGAIVADDGLRTNLPDVWAAGDCAEVLWIDGARRPEQLWYTARDQGRVAGAAMTGEEITYRRTAWYNSAKFFDVEYTTAGYIPPDLNRLTPAAGSAAGPIWSRWYQQAPGAAITQRIVIKDGRVVGFNCLGTRWDHTVFLRWIRERRSLEWVLAHMEEARFDEEFMQPFRVLPSAALTTI